jgi:hypothetical protein
VRAPTMEGGSGPSTAICVHGGAQLVHCDLPRPWRARGCERQPWRAAAAHGRKHLLREPRPPAAAAPAASAPAVLAAASAPTSSASSPSRWRGSARSAHRRGIELPSESTMGGPHARRLEVGGLASAVMGQRRAPSGDQL